MANHNYKKYYSKGSAALEVYEPNIQEPQIEVAPKRVTRKKTAPNKALLEKHRTINKLNAKSKVFFILIGAYSFALAIWCIAVNVENANLKIGLDNTNAVIAENYSKIEDLQVVLAQSYDLKSVEEYAKTKLNMDKPSTEQIISIDLINENYTEYSAEESNVTLWDRIKGVFDGQ